MTQHTWTGCKERSEAQREVLNVKFWKPMRWSGITYC